MVITSIATAKDTTIDSTTADVDGSLVTYDTYLTTAIDIPLDIGSSADGDRCRLCYRHFRP